MDSDGHFLSLATVVLGGIFFMVTLVGGVMIYVFFKYGKKEKES